MLKILNQIIDVLSKFYMYACAVFVTFVVLSIFLFGGNVEINLNYDVLKNIFK
jgi:hypothetical protein